MRMSTRTRRRMMKMMEQKTIAATDNACTMSSTGSGRVDLVNYEKTKMPRNV